MLLGIRLYAYRAHHAATVPTLGRPEAIPRPSRGRPSRLVFYFCAFSRSAKPPSNWLAIA
jgi:hypothetical protein